ncbi:MAG: hypothetical protein JWR07_4082 [Nevskia sp.]|nr:hypothetical protein [Nevskia sp.]
MARLPRLTVRWRLIVLIGCLLALFGGADLVQGYMIGEVRAGQASLREEYRRFEVIQAVQQAIIETRHIGGQLNSAIMVGDVAAQTKARKAQVIAQQAVSEQLKRLAAFEPGKAQLISESLASLESDSEKAIHLLAEHREKEAAPSVAEVQRRANLVQNTLDDIAMQERNTSERVLLLSEQRIDLVTWTSLAAVIFAFTVGLPLAVLVGHSIVQPLKKVAAAIADVNAGKLDFELPPLTKDEFGQVALALVQFRDGSEALRRIAFYDSLTGLGNRLSLERAIAVLLAGGNGAAPVTVLLFDLDNFRSINDQYGYSAGDEYLCEAAARLHRFIPEQAELFRFGGDRFVAVLALTGDRSVDDLRELAECVLRGMSSPHLQGPRLLNMSVSIGVAVSPADGESAQHLISSAEAAGRAAKRSGRNNVRFAGGMFTAAMRSQMVLAGDIRRALEHGEFELYYQPIIDGPKGHVVGAEALVRWRHPQRGLVAPAEFIAAAEDAGLIGALGEKCLRMAHAQATRWLSMGLNLRIAVNMSARQIQDSRVLEPLKALRAQGPEAAAMIELELTETVWVERSENTRRALEEIRRMGYRLGMDDFGTGYSSFANLQWLPVDKIKIDRQFVDNMAVSQQAVAIISAVIALARTLNLTVVAEGVETQQQMDMLLQQGCTLFQGYLFSPALPSLEFEAWVADFTAERARYTH